MYQAMNKLHIPPKIIRLVKKLNKIICKMRIQNELSEPFESTKETRRWLNMPLVEPSIG